MRISDWSSDVCSSDLVHGQVTMEGRFDSNSIQTKLISYDIQRRLARVEDQNKAPAGPLCDVRYSYDEWGNVRRIQAAYTQTEVEGRRCRSEEHTSELQSLMRISYAVFCLKKKKHNTNK